MTGLHFHSLTVRHVVSECEDAITVTFDVPLALRDTFAFEAGQYLTLRRAADDVRRSYSICAAAGEPLRVGVRRVAGGVFSAWVHEALRPGMAVDVMPPQGRFGARLARATPRARGVRVLGIAGGSGITPILSIMKTVLGSQPDSRFTLLYANRHARSMMFKEEIEDLKNLYLTRLAIHPVFSREQVDQPLHAGRLDRDKLVSLLGVAGPVDEAYICGPHALNDEAEAVMLAAGLRADSIHVERFGVPPALAAVAPHAVLDGDAPTALITIVRDGLTREVPFTTQDVSVLAAAARAGLDVPWSCRSGVCATCRARVLNGQVRMDRNFALDPSELAAGYVLTCQAHPLTDRVVVSFDER